MQPGPENSAGLREVRQLWDDNQTRALLSLPGICDVGKRYPLGVDSQFAVGTMRHYLFQGFCEDVKGGYPGSSGDRQGRTAEHRSAERDGRSGGFADLDKASLRLRCGKFVASEKIGRASCRERV